MHRPQLFRKAMAVLLCCAALLALPSQINARPLSITPLSSTAIPNPSILAGEVTETVTAGHLVSLVYRYAGRGTVIGCLENGTLLNILDSKGEFYRIDCYDMTGYIAKTQVRSDGSGQYYVSCDPNSSESKYLSSRSTQAAASLRGAVQQRAVSLVGVPYVIGGTSPSGFDCSGFTQYIMQKIGLDLHRNALSQLQDGIIIPKSDLQCGDLVFFSNTTGYGHFASHIGIYLGNGKLIHAGSSGIAIVDLDSAYFTYHYLCARRVILSDLTPGTAAGAAGAFQKPTTSYWRQSADGNE